MKISRRDALAGIGSAMLAPLLSGSEASAAASITPLGGAFRFEGQSGGKSDPRLFPLDAGGFVATWTQDVSGGSSHGYVRYFADNATAPKAPIPIGIPDPSFPTTNSLRPVAFADGTVQVVFRDARDDLDASDVFGQRLSAQHATVGTPSLLNKVTRSTQRDPLAVRLKNGNLLVLWKSAVGTSDELRSRVFSPSGAPVTNETRVVLKFSELQSLAPLKDGGAVVVFESQAANYDYLNYALRLSATGVKVGTPLLLRRNLLELTSTLNVTGLNNGGFMVLWADDGFMKGKSYSAAAAPTATISFALTNGHEESYPIAATLADGRVLVVVAHNVTANVQGYKSQMLAYLLSATGKRLLGAVVLTPLVRQDSYHPKSLVRLKSGTFVASWDSGRTTLGNNGYGVRVKVI